MANPQVAITPNAPIEIHVASKRMHITAYKVWLKPPGPGASWTLMFQGHTGDLTPDVASSTVQSGTTLAYWYGVVSKEDSAAYAVQLTISQNGQLLTGGDLVATGQTNDNAVADVEGQVDLT